MKTVLSIIVLVTAVSSAFAASDGLSDVVARIGAQYRVAIVAFVPQYPFDVSSIVLRGTVDQSLGALAAALDGHVEKLTPVLYAIVPNFRVDAPSAPLVPQVQAAVHGTSALAYLIEAVPDGTRREKIFSPLGASIDPASIQDLTYQGRSLREQLGVGSNKAIAVSAHPEWIITVRYGGLTLGSYDAYDQAAHSVVSWYPNSSITAEQIARVSFPATKQVESSPAIAHGRMLTVNGTRLVAGDLAMVLGSGKDDIVVDLSLAGRAVALTSSVYDSGMLWEAVSDSLQLRVIPFTDPGNASGRSLVTGPLASDDRRIVRGAVEHEIVRVWASALADAQQAIPLYSAGPFGYEDCVHFASIDYPRLNSVQKECVDELLALLPVALTPDQFRNIRVTARPGLVVRGMVGSDVTNTLEQRGTLYEDVSE